MVTRDRIELPTRGFSDTFSEFPNRLKITLAAGIIEHNNFYGFSDFIRFSHFGKLFHTQIRTQPPGVRRPNVHHLKNAQVTTVHRFGHQNENLNILIISSGT
jgi:hypothetical protein